MANQQVMESELGWLAGFFDGEGYIGLRVEPHTRQGIVYIRPEMNIVNTDEVMIERAVDIMSRLGAKAYVSKRRIKNRRYPYIWRTQMRSQAKLARLLEVLTPHMTGRKQERSALVLEFCKLRMAQPSIDKHIARGIEGLAGNGACKPYTRRQIEIFKQVQPMMRRGPRTSETIRRMRQQIDQLINDLEAYRSEVETDLEMTLEEYLA